MISGYYRGVRTENVPETDAGNLHRNTCRK